MIKRVLLLGGMVAALLLFTGCSSRRHSSAHVEAVGEAQCTAMSARGYTTHTDLQAWLAASADSMLLRVRADSIVMSSGVVYGAVMELGVSGPELVTERAEVRSAEEVSMSAEATEFTSNVVEDMSSGAEVSTGPSGGRGLFVAVLFAAVLAVGVYVVRFRNR